MIIGVGGSNVAVERCHFVPIGGSSRHKADCRQPTDDDCSRYSHLYPFSLLTPPQILARGPGPSETPRWRQNLVARTAKLKIPNHKIRSFYYCAVCSVMIDAGKIDRSGQPIVCLEGTECRHWTR